MYHGCYGGSGQNMDSYTVYRQATCTLYCYFVVLSVQVSIIIFLLFSFGNRCGVMMNIDEYRCCVDK